MSKTNRGRRPEEEASTLIEKSIYINRVAKVVKGGRRFSFSAIVVAGDGSGQVGVGSGKAGEVPEAIRKATEKARASMIAVPIMAGTVPHEVEGSFGATMVVLQPASPGTGVIAGATVRAILDSAGFHNVLTKVVGSNNPHNVVRATMDALRRLESSDQYAIRLGRTTAEVNESYYVLAKVSSAGRHA